MTDILTCVREFFREKGASYYRKLQHTGYLRHLMLRRGVTSGEILVHLVTMGTMTAGVGDFANFLFGCTFVVPAGIIYRLHHNKSRKHAVIGMAAGTVLTTAAACLMNAFVLLPAYGKAFGMPIEAFIEMGSAVHPSVNSLLGFVSIDHRSI